MEQIKSWNFDILNKQGYWLYSNDFKNIEITLIFKMLEAEKRDKLYFYCNSFYSTMTIKEKKKLRNILMLYCGGSSYHNNISVDGKLQMKKEQHHAENIIDKPNEKMDLGNFIRKNRI